VKKTPNRKNKDGWSWMWSDNTIYEYEAFDQGQPDNHGNVAEECVALLGPQKKWHDAPCIVKLNYLCQKCPVGGGDCGGAGQDKEEEGYNKSLIALAVLLPIFFFLIPGTVLGCYFCAKMKKREEGAPNEVKKSGANPEPGQEL
jgi:hypothetical protein